MKKVLLGTIFLIFCFETIFLSMQNRIMKEQITAYNNIINKVEIFRNNYFPDISLIDLNNHQKKLFNQNNDKRSLLLIFSLNCDFCKQMINKLNKYYETNTVYRIFGISIADISETKIFLSNNTAKFPIYCLKDEDKKKLQLSKLPVTLFLMPNGEIIKSLLGDIDIPRE